MNLRPWHDRVRQDRHEALIAIGSPANGAIPTEIFLKSDPGQFSPQRHITGGGSDKTHVRRLVSSLIWIILVSTQALGQNPDSELGGQTYIEVRDVVGASAIGLRDEVANGCGSSAFFERTQDGDWVLRAPDIEDSARIEDVLTDDEAEGVGFFLSERNSGTMSIRDYIDLAYSGSGTPPPCASDEDAAWMIVFLNPSDQAGTNLLAEIQKGCDSSAFFERTTTDGWVIRAPGFEYTGALENLVGTKWRESLPETLEAMTTDSGTILLRDWINRRLSESDEQPFCSE